MKSGLYVFEGPNGVGKTTLSSKLNSLLNKWGSPSELVALPGRKAGSLGEHVYRLYHHPQTFGVRHISITAEQLLFTSAHADVIENEVLPALAKKRNVVLDRYWWSTWVYSNAGGLDPDIRDQLLNIEVQIWQGTLPECVFLIRRNRPEDSEHDLTKWRRLVSLYDAICSQEATRVRIIEVDNNGSIETSMKRIMAVVDQNLNRNDHP